ncbi:polysaccharide deacetylase family protein [Alkalihalobacillus hwajinpoensis]|uniref:polysaccharide deacetylase family protein n=1 Tax=Guptibacillus hwajinpoensis TaxID=208199 RepID=UPI0018846EAF|nr:polysaccharide deacetylase family protein [Pseudalkalibacillus hwajinpoensis]MBF0705476.1 polysaccharide deacetylase family protein [Pseudalkalibacillus hwajinpoensis]
MKKIYLFSFVLLAIIGSLVGFGWGDMGTIDLDQVTLSTNESSSTAEASHQEDHEEEKINEQELRIQKLEEAAERGAAPHIPVLTYHNIISKENLKERHYGDDGNLSSTIVLLEDFKQQMNVLHENGFFTLTLEEFEKYITSEIPVPEKSVLLTFDDGHKNNYIEAYPVLKKYDFHAVEFLITNRNKDKTVPYNTDTNQYLSHQEIEAASDVFEYASHTNSFHNLDNGTPYLISKSLPEIQEDVETSIELIGDTNALAYPYGAYDEQTMEAMDVAGIDFAFTVQAGYVQPGDDTLQIHRNSVRPYNTIEDFKNVMEIN